MVCIRISFSSKVEIYFKRCLNTAGTSGRKVSRHSSHGSNPIKQVLSQIWWSTVRTHSVAESRLHTEKMIRNLGSSWVFTEWHFKKATATPTTYWSPRHKSNSVPRSAVPKRVVMDFDIQMLGLTSQYSEARKECDDGDCFGSTRKVSTHGSLATSSRSSKAHRFKHVMANVLVDTLAPYFFRQPCFLSIVKHDIFTRSCFSCAGMCISRCGFIFTEAVPYTTQKRRWCSTIAWWSSSVRSTARGLPIQSGLKKMMLNKFLSWSWSLIMN